jgi:hypothetical protein
MRNVACVLEGGENAYKIFAGKLEGKRLLWIPSHRWVDIIKMSLQGIRHLSGSEYSPVASS